MSRDLHLPLDLRWALRSARRRPAVPLLAVAILALGLGGFTALWSAADAVLWQPLPYPQGERLVRLWGVGNGEPRNNVNPLDVSDWRTLSRSFDEVAMFGASLHTVTGAGAPEYLPVPRVSAGFFDVLGAQPALGRFFSEREQTPGEHRVAVLSWEFWQSRYAGARGVLGRTLQLDGRPYTIVGVAPRGLRHPAPEQLAPAALYRALPIDPENGRGGHYVTAFARLRPGVSVDTAQAELAGLQEQIGKEQPGSAEWGVFVEPLHDTLAGPSRQAIVLLLAATVLLLLLACGNVAALLLARAAGRAAELAVRGALGATRPALVRQLTVEMAVVGAAAGLGGVTLGWALLAGLRGLAAGQVPLIERAAIDGRALAAALLATLLTVAVAGVAPALHGLRTAFGARATASRERRRLERVLVAAQLALCLVLLVGAALLGRSLQSLYAVDPGFRAAGSWTFGMYLPADRYPEDAMAPPFFARLEERLLALPGVEGAGAVSILPLSGGYSCSSIVAEGDAAADPAAQPCAEERIVTSGYFGAAGLPVLAGRGFGAGDSAAAGKVAVVSESFARHHWPGASPLGRRVGWGDEASESTAWMTVVGVVADVRHFGLDAPHKPEVYMPLAQVPSSGMEVVVRTAGDDAPVVDSLRGAVAELDPQLPLARLRPLDELVADSTAARRLRTWAVGGFAALATLLASAGLYGSLAHAVGTRRRELSVRMAVGAGRRQIVRLVLGEGAALAAAGLLVGGGAAIAGARALRQLLFGVEPLDAASFAAAAGVLALVALIAAWLPARRAAAVEPAQVLRNDG
jgi:putative ABC transport system permease protein